MNDHPRNCQCSNCHAAIEREACSQWLQAMTDTEYGQIACDFLMSVSAGTTLKQDGIESLTEWAFENRWQQRRAA